VSSSAIFFLVVHFLICLPTLLVKEWGVQEWGAPSLDEPSLFNLASFVDGFDEISNVGSADLSIHLRFLVGYFTRLRFSDLVVLVLTTAAL
jgi:hypothetical protein